MYQQQQSADSIQVLIRIKPGCEDEAIAYTANQVKLDKHSFGFDKVFSPLASQEDIFNAVGKKLIGHALQGYNSCVFVYGQTGSGKTFTMMGNSSGLMQRSFGQLFSKIDRLSNTQCIVTCSYFEIYNEHIIDLLDTKKERKNLNIRQDVRRGMFVQNLTEELALNSQKIVECLNTGMKNRHTGQTMMNRESSRSHSIFTISLSIKQDIDGKKILKTPKLHFVDLAGSQRQKMTMATGDRLKEAGNINKSLTTLGMVINALATEKNKTHIPYRDSKLTCLLKDSLGGNSKTFIIATVSPSTLCFQQSLSTLNFANRAKMVKVKALINQESLSTNIEQYKEQIRKLKQQIMKIKSDKKVSFQYPYFNESTISKNNGDLQNKFQQISHKIQDLKTNLMNSNVQNIIDIIGKISSKKTMIEERYTQKIDQQNGMFQQNYDAQDAQEQGNQLLCYMQSNHQLLKKIHSALNDYNFLKEQIKNVEINKRMPLEDIKTPSKFERDQYQDLLEKRQNYIKELEQKVVKLKEVNFKKQVQNKDLRRKINMNEDNKQTEQQNFMNMRNSMEELQGKNADLQLQNQILYLKNNSNQKLISQMETRVKESKELYVYSEQKYQNERSIRNRLESNIKQLNKKYQKLQVQKREELESYQGKIEEYQDKIQQFQRKDDQLRNELQIMNETLEFNSKKIKQYTEKCSQMNKLIQQLSQNKIDLSQKNTELTYEIQKNKMYYQNTLSQAKIENNQFKNHNYFLQQQINKTKNEKLKIEQSYEAYQKNSKEVMESLQMQLINNNQILKQISNQQQIEKNQHTKIKCQYSLKILQLSKKLTLIENKSAVEKKQKQQLQKQKQQLQQKYQKDTKELNQCNEQILNQKQLILIECSKNGELLKQTQTKIKELENQVFKTKDIVEEYQQLKKTYKQMIIQNYKLKGEYISNTHHSMNQTNDNKALLSKVVYYQQRFTLMSIQYNKLQQTAKKLMQKQASLQKKLLFFQENQKLKKITDSLISDEIKQQNLQALQLQNSQLKAEINKLKATYETKMTNDKKEDYSKKINLDNYKYELEQKQEKIKKRLQCAIKTWDHSKENNCTGMALQEMLQCWQKIEYESRKKIQDVKKSIKQQQKIKSQNKFIVKQNIYLKQKVDALQKEMNFSAVSKPRKQIKLNEVNQQ